MNRDSRRKLQGVAGALVVAALVMLSSCQPGEDTAGSGAGGPEAEASVVVAQIGDISITKDELKQRLAQEIRPQRDNYGLAKPVPTAASVLQTMLGEKAMALEGRQRNLLDDEITRSSMRQFRQRQLIRLFLTEYVEEHVSVDEAEIQAAAATDPNLTPEQAESKAYGTKATQTVNALYDQLLEQLKVEKVTENFPRAAQIHQRLLTRPVETRSRGVFWITNKQIREELTDEEKQIVMARYTGGQIILRDWFEAIGQIAPPGRPKDLNTVAGVETFLDRALKPAIYAAAAVAQGYDKNEQFLAQMRTREDMMLLGKVRSEKYQEATEPGDDEVKAYYEAHKEQFGKQASLKVEQIWCPDLGTAEKVKQMVEDGTSFESANAAHGLRKDQKPHNVYPTGEGLFWDELWKAEPNDVLGPLKGFYDAGVQWRVVKVLEKTPAEPRDYSENAANQARSAIMSQRRDTLLADYAAELLQKYDHEIFADRIADIDPLAVTPIDEQGG